MSTELALILAFAAIIAGVAVEILWTGYHAKTAWRAARVADAAACQARESAMTAVAIMAAVAAERTREREARRRRRDLLAETMNLPVCAPAPDLTALDEALKSWGSAR